ncbi:MAG: hypothetical protein HOQ30_14575, partial [Gemmatimonadaceae bacterium]|nr:hypothetical protein [Gemmatimonadaceae bacterium]
MQPSVACWHGNGTPATGRPPIPTGGPDVMVDRRTHIADTLRQRILSGLHLGTLRPGARLPST